MQSTVALAQTQCRVKVAHLLTPVSYAPGHTAFLGARLCKTKQLCHAAAR